MAKELSFMKELFNKKFGIQTLKRVDYKKDLTTKPGYGIPVGKIDECIGKDLSIIGIRTYFELG